MTGFPRSPRLFISASLRGRSDPISLFQPPCLFAEFLFRGPTIAPNLEQGCIPKAVSVAPRRAELETRQVTAVTTDKERSVFRHRADRREFLSDGAANVTLMKVLGGNLSTGCYGRFSQMAH